MASVLSGKLIYKRSYTSQKFPFSFLWNRSSVALIDIDPVSSLQGRALRAASFYASLTVTNGVMSFALWLWVASQAPQHFRFCKSFTMIAFPCQSVCWVIFLDSSMCRIVDPQESEVWTLNIVSCPPRLLIPHFLFVCMSSSNLIWCAVQLSLL